jgi:hypothetical protein
VDTFKGYVEASNQFTLHNIFTHIVYIIIPIRRHMFRKVNYWYPHMTNGNKRIYSLSIIIPIRRHMFRKVNYWYPHMTNGNKRIYSLSLPKCQSYVFWENITENLDRKLEV